MALLHRVAESIEKDNIRLHTIGHSYYACPTAGNLWGWFSQVLLVLRL
jgi:hypothetical protein